MWTVSGMWGLLLVKISVASWELHPYCLTFTWEIYLFRKKNCIYLDKMPWYFGMRPHYALPPESEKAKVLVAQLCPSLCDCMDCILPGSSVHGILQARILEWAAIPLSRGSSQPRDWTWVSCTAGSSLPSEPPEAGSNNNTCLSKAPSKVKGLIHGEGSVLFSSIICVWMCHWMEKMKCSPC